MSFIHTRELTKHLRREERRNEEKRGLFGSNRARWHPGQDADLHTAANLYTCMNTTHTQTDSFTHHRSPGHHRGQHTACLVIVLSFRLYPTIRHLLPKTEHCYSEYFKRASWQRAGGHAGTGRVCVWFDLNGHLTETSKKKKSQPGWIRFMLLKYKRGKYGSAIRINWEKSFKAS